MAPKPPTSTTSLSTTEVPTVQTLNTTKRSLSYNLAEEPSPTSPVSPSHSPSNSQHKIDATGADNMTKASLTGLLNTPEVRNGARERKVQNLLMNTQRGLKEKRRASLRQSVGSTGPGIEGMRGQK